MFKKYLSMISDFVSSFRTSINVEMNTWALSVSFSSYSLLAKELILFLILSTFLDYVADNKSLYNDIIAI